MKKTKTPRATSANTNPAILPLEAAAKSYALARSALADRVREFEREVARLRETYLPGIKLHAAKAAFEQSVLERLIVSNKPLFDEPRTLSMHGIKFGLQKGKGKVEFDDADKVVERIRSQFPKAQAELLLDVKITPRKDALITLDAAALKKLGVTITGTGDSVIIKATDGDVDKLVARILEESTKADSGEKEAA